MYPHWNDGVFYPKGERRYLSFYNERFNSVEINASFYRCPTPDTVCDWGRQLKTGSKLVLKVPRSVTHTRRLKMFSFLATNGIDLLAYFIEGLDTIPPAKRGPVLLQVPPKMKIDLERLEDVLAFFGDHNVRVAFEARNDSWFTYEMFQLLEKYGGALVASDLKECHSQVVDTGTFVYIRRHGPYRYAGRYSPEDMAEDALIVNDMSLKGRDVYVFYNNDGHGAAPQDALQLCKLVSGLGGIMPLMRS